MSRTARVPRISLLVVSVVPALLGGACPRPNPPPPYPCSGPYSTQAPIFLELPAVRMVFQRDPLTDLGSIVIKGTYDAILAGVAPSAIEARWGNDVWTVVDPAPEGGAFEGVLEGQDAQRGRQTVQVRFANAPGVAASVADVGIGDQMVVAGQSNAVLLFATLTQSLLGASKYSFQVDPLDPNRVHWASDPLHGCPLPLLPSFGSMYPALMDRIIAETGVPILFIAGATANMGIGGLQPGVQPPDPDGWTPLIRSVEDATGQERCPRLMLFFQGESDVGWRTTEEYTDLFLSFDAAFQAEMSCTVPIVIGVIGSIELGGHGTYQEAREIRRALRRLPGTRPHLFAGPETVDLPLSVDGLHFSDAAAPELLERWCAAINASGVLPCH